MTVRIAIDVACNDPDNGLFAHRAEQIHVMDLFELTPRRRTPTFRETDQGFRLAGKAWPTIASKDWVGNWCWNRYVLTLPVAVDFLAWLHGRGLYGCDQAEARIFNRWRDARAFNLPDRIFLERQLEKAALRFAGCT